MLKKTEMFTKTRTKAHRYILIKPFFLAVGWSYLNDLSHVHVLKKIETTMRWNCMSKALPFPQIMAKHQDRPFFTVFLTMKNFIPKYLDKALTDFARTSRGRYWRKKLPWTSLEEQFLVPIFTAASKIGNSVISLLWQLQCCCNSKHKKFSSLSNTTVVAVFTNLCLGWRSLCSNLRGIDPEKLYWATLVYLISLYT